MNKRMVLSIFAAAIFVSSAVVFAQEAPAPSFKDGDTWQFNFSRKGQVGSSTDRNEGMYELSVQQGAVKLYELNGSQKSEIAIESEGPSQGLLRLIGKSEQRPDLKFPLSVGQKWNYEYIIRPAGSRRDQKRSVEITVTGMEQLRTPAGDFKAYKLSKTESWSGRGGAQGGSSTTTFFFSPESGSVVKLSTANDNNPGTLEVELIKFSRGQ